MPLQPSPYAQLAAALSTGWHTIARPEQLPPPGDWSIWLVMAGRGFGKTRTGAEWTIEQIARGKKRIALLGPTAADVRDTMVEGESGVLACSPAWNRPEYEPSKRRLTWPNGAIATCFSADEPERLRGPQHEAAWGDEIGSWRYATDAWDNLMFGLRIGANPQALMTTTPRRTKLLRDLLIRAEQMGADGALLNEVIVTRGRTTDNAANLSANFMKAIVGKYSGTRLGRQELDGEMLDDVPGALWQREWIDRDRVDKAPDLVRIVVAIDPSVTSSEGADESGIVVAGKGVDGDAYVLDDKSLRGAPHEWAREAIKAFHHHRADCIIAEVNNGGEMVENTIRHVDISVPYKAVHASRGKVTRAEPISALYEQRRVHHVGTHAALEDQQCGFTSDFDRSRAGYSPDRVDALVWALTELMGAGTAGWGLLEYYRKEADAVPAYGKPIAAPAREVTLIGPGTTSHVYTMSGARIAVEADGSVTVTEEDAAPLRAAGWREPSLQEN